MSQEVVGPTIVLLAVRADGSFSQASGVRTLEMPFHIGLLSRAVITKETVNGLVVGFHVFSGGSRQVGICK